MFLLRHIHPSWVFYGLVFGVLAGLIAGVTLHISLVPSFILCALFGIVIILAIHIPSLSAIIIVFVIGFILGNFRSYPVTSSEESIRAYFGQTVTVTGRLTDDPDTKSGSPVIHLGNLTLESTSETRLRLSGELYITLASPSPDLERSDVVTLTGKLSEGFGTFLGKIYRPEITSISRAAHGDIFARFKRWFSDQIRTFIPSPEVDLGLGYLMGMKTGLSTEFSEALSAVGMTHVVVASGAHLAILTGAARKVFGKISKFAGLLFSLLMIAAFVLVVGFTPSMTRAALVATLSLLVGYVGRTFTPVRLIGFVAMLTLLIDPQNFLNLGWQLSFASFFGILIVAPRLQTTFYGGKHPPWLASTLVTSISTSLVCAPVLIYNFGSLSFLSLFANLIILPTLPYAMLGMIITGVVSPLSILATPSAWLTTKLLSIHIWLIEYLSTKTMFIITPPSGNPFVYLLYLPVSLYLITPHLGHFWRKVCRSRSSVSA